MKALKKSNPVNALHHANISQRVPLKSIKLFFYLLFEFKGPNSACKNVKKMAIIVIDQYEFISSRLGIWSYRPALVGLTR